MMFCEISLFFGNSRFQVHVEMRNLRPASGAHESQKSEFFCTTFVIFRTRGRMMMIRSAFERFTLGRGGFSTSTTLKVAADRKDGYEVE